MSSGLGDAQRALREVLETLGAFQPVREPPAIRRRPRPRPERQPTHDSAAELVHTMSDIVDGWLEDLEPDEQAVIIAILGDQTALRVVEMTAQGHDVVILRGETANGPCMLVAHQATIQLICFIERITPQATRRTIGFNVDWPDEPAKDGAHHDGDGERPEPGR